MFLEKKSGFGELKVSKACLFDGFVVPYMSLWEDSSLWNEQVDFILSLGFSKVLISTCIKLSNFVFQDTSLEGSERSHFISLISDALSAAKEKGLQIAFSVEMQNPSLFFTRRKFSCPFLPFLEAVCWRSLCFDKEAFSKEDLLELTAQEKLEKEVSHLLSLFPLKSLLLNLSFFPKKQLPWLYKTLELLPSQISPIICPYTESGGLHPYLQQKPFDVATVSSLLFTMDPKGLFPSIFHVIFLSKMDAIFSFAGSLPKASFLLPVPKPASTLACAIICGINSLDERKQSLHVSVTSSLKKIGVLLADLESFPGYTFLVSAVAIYQLLFSSYFKRYEEKKEQFTLCYKLLDASQKLWKKEGIEEIVEAIDVLKKDLESLAKTESVTLNPSSASQQVFSFSR